MANLKTVGDALNSTPRSPTHVSFNGLDQGNPVKGKISPFLALLLSYIPVEDGIEFHDLAKKLPGGETVEKQSKLYRALNNSLASNGFVEKKDSEYFLTQMAQQGNYTCVYH